jgi:hypothetical protein
LGIVVKGWGASKACHLNISTSKGTVTIPIPTKEKADEIRKIYSAFCHKG